MSNETTLPANGVQRTFAVLRALAAAPAQGTRVTQIAKDIGLTQGTTHRLLQSLVNEGMVEQDERSKLYRLGMDLFSLAARAGNGWDCARCAGRYCCACAVAWATPCSCWCVRASMRCAWTASTGRSRSAPSPATSAGAWRWAWARARWRSWRSCRKKNATK